MKTRKSRKRKRLLLGVGALAPAVASALAVVSCSPLLGALDKYDSDTDGVIVIQTTWASSGKPISSLGKIASKYNELEKGKPGFMRVEVQHVQGGPGTIPSQVLTKIQSRDKKTLPNLYIDYPSAEGMIAPYKMIFDAGGKDGLSRDIFEPMFVGVNDNIAGIPKGGLYSIPLAKSTEGLTMDRSLLKYLFEELEKNGFTIKGKYDVDKVKNPTIHSIMNQVITTADRKSITENWGVVIKSALNANNFNIINGNRVGEAGDIINNKVIDESIFENYMSLFTFAKVIQPLFENKAGGNLLGIDSPSNLTYILSSLMAKNNMDNFLFVKDNAKNKIDYRFLDSESPAKNIFQNVYKVFLEDLINNDSIWVGGGGAYGSERLKDHLMAISLGSSAGLNKSYSTKSNEPEKMGTSEVGYSLPIGKLYSNDSRPAGDQYDWDKVNSVVSQGPSINTVHISEDENKAAVRFLKWLYGDTKYDFGNGQYTPTQIFAEDSSYIVPTKGAFDAESVIGRKVANKTFDELVSNRDTQNLLGLKMSFETLSNQIALAKNNDLAAIFDVPVGIDTGAMRTMITSKMKASSNSKNSGSSAYSALSIWNDIRDQAIINGMIDGNVDKVIYKYPSQLNRNFSNIDWSWYNYVDATIEEWIDGDTPKVKIINVHSKTKALDSIKAGEEYNIRISGIDTPEAHVKLGDVKHFKKVGKNSVIATMDEEFIKNIIDKYDNYNRPLGSISQSSSGTWHYNELNYTYDPLNNDRANLNKKYGYWENIYVDIQTPNLTKPNIQGDKIVTPDNLQYDWGSYPPNEDATFNWREADYKGKKILTPAVLNEGYWGWRAGDFGRNVLPKGSVVRIATDGKKSYNRIVGSIFFDKDQKRSIKRAKSNTPQIFNANYSVEITRAGLTLPLIGNPGGITEPNNILWENGVAIADAFNYALSNPLQTDRNKDSIIYDYASSHPDDPNRYQTLLSYKNQYILEMKTDGVTIGYNNNFVAASLTEWLNKALITHGATEFSSLIRGNNNGGSIYQYLKYRNPVKTERRAAN